ncbi:MAG: hypothetical protein COB04_18365, partial [Gammaproteobacteria bacterium]
MAKLMAMQRTSRFIFLCAWLCGWCGALAWSGGVYAEITVEPQPACEFNPLEGPEMVLIESGVFSMGSPADEENRASDEGPVHQVAVQAFSLSRCEVTVQEFETFVSETGYITDAEQFDLEGQVKGCFGFAETNAENWRNPGFSQTSQSAVVCVSFRDTQAYSLWLSLRTGQSYRLPSEAEWEYAARGTKATAYPWGKEASHEYANYSGVGARDQWQYTSPVGSFSANDFGLYDMHGNAWEWAEDCWQGDYNGAPVDGSP